MASTKEYQWSHVKVFMLGRFVTGIQGVSYTPKQEKEYVYGMGNEPRAIQSGNKRYEGDIKILQSELEALIKAAPGKDILSLRFDIVVSYVPDGDAVAITTDVLKNCEFTEQPKSISQQDKMMEITLPIMFLSIKHQV